MSNAGWYPDPAGSELLRYYDGDQWTDQLKSNENQVSTQDARMDLSDIFNISEPSIGENNENQFAHFTSPFEKIDTIEDNFGLLKQLDNNKKAKKSHKRVKAENYANERTFLKKLISFIKKIVIFIIALILATGLYAKFKSSNNEKYLGNVITKEKEDSINTNKSANTDTTNPSKDLVKDSTIPNDENPVLDDLILSEDNMEGSSLSQIVEVDKFVSSLDASTKKEGIKMIRKIHGKSLNVTLNPNGSVKIEGKKEIGYGDGKYLYLPKNLILEIESDLDTKNMFKILKQKYIRTAQNNAQIGSTLFSSNYYDGCNFPKFYDTLKKNIAKVKVTNSQGYKVYNIETTGGNDWVKIFVNNDKIEKVLIDEGSSYEVEISYQGPGVAKIVIPKGNYAKF